MYSVGKNISVAEGRGFEPRRPREEPTHFPGVPVQPLLHPSLLIIIPQFYYNLWLHLSIPILIIKKR